MKSCGLVVRAALVLGIASALVVGEGAIVRAAAHAEVAHQILAAGTSSPPIGAGLLALLVVGVRLLVRVFMPGAVLLVLARLAADVFARDQCKGDGGGVDSISIGISDGDPGGPPFGERGRK